MKSVLFLIADDLRPQLGCYGQAAHTPNIDRLAAEGMRFDRAYCQQAWCCPSRTSLLTGLRPDATRVYDLETHFRDTVADVVTLPQQFMQAGHHAACFGKVYHEGMDDPASWSAPTFVPPVGDPLRHYLSEANVTQARTGPRKGYADPTECMDVDDDAYADGQSVTAAIEAMRQQKPFFMAVGFYKPHMPFCAPKRYWDLYDPAQLPVPDVIERPAGSPPYAFQDWAEHHNYRGVPREINGTPLPEQLARQLVHGYHACVSYVDAQVGRLLRALEGLGRAEDTLVVLTADHGWKLGEYGCWSKHTNYDVDTRVPLILRGPGVPAGRASDAIVELLDVYPTLCELAGLSAPSHIQGESLVPLIDGSTTCKRRPMAFSQFIRNDTRTHTTTTQATVMGRAVRTERYRAVRWHPMHDRGQTLAFELYDEAQVAPPVNRADDPGYSAVRRELTGVLA